MAASPPYEDGRPLSAEDEAALYARYGVPYDESGAPMGSPVARPVAGPASGGDRKARLRMYWP
ncbi:MAG: hypothetical protein ACRD0J_03330 [Acidimicrobiales bacterium]